jgi:hypothetical protein
MLQRFCWLLLWLVSMPAHAVPISVSFSGVTTGTMNVAGMPQFGNFDGLEVIGAFAFDTAQGASGFLSFIVPERTQLDFSSAIRVWFSPGPFGDSITLDDRPPFNGRPPFTRVSLTAPAGSLPFQFGSDGQLLGLDATAFDPSVIDSIGIFFNRRPGPLGAIRIDRTSFSGFGAPVPIPGTLGLLLLGLPAGLFAAWRRRTSV